MNRAQVLGRDRLIIFGRYPVPGQTKTRLIPALGLTGAADLQRHLAERTVRTARTIASCYEMEVEFCFEGGSEKKIRRWLGSGLLLSQQAPQDLGERMEIAFQKAFQAGSRRVVLFGTDIPGLTERQLREAFQSLEKKDLILGPSTDGGYWLIGLKKPAPLFTDIHWGVSSVLEKTLSKAEALGLTVHQLDPLTDIDTVEGLGKGMPEWVNPRPYVSVILPVLNESANVEAAIAHAKNGEAEIIVVDGGSSDDTVEKAFRAGARIVKSACGRATQQNAGAVAARGKALLFLHADTRLPEGYVAHVFESLLDQRTVIGAFRFKTDLNTPLMKVIEFLTLFRSQVLKLPYGDQALFIRKSLFDKEGGFPTVPIAEDLSFVRRISKKGLVTIAPAAVVTSARRWKKLGVVRTTLLNQIVLMGLLLGVCPHTLARLYRRSKK